MKAPRIFLYNRFNQLNLTIACIHIMADPSGVIAVYSGRSLIECGKNIAPNIADVGGIAIKALQNIFDVAVVEFEQTAFDNLGRKILSGNANLFFAAAQRLKHNVHNFVQPFGVAFLF